MAKKAICAAVLLIASCGPMSYPPEPGTDLCGDVKHLERSIVNGVESHDPEIVDLTSGQLRAIGALNLDLMGSCTAALVAPDVVLTAAHCVESLTGTPRFLVGEDYMPPEAVFNGVEWHMHPLYEGSGGGGSPPYDVAVIIISGDPISRGIEPLAVNLEETSLLGERIQSVGYGLTDPSGSWNTRRWWTTQEVISESPAIYIASDGGRSGLCQGDSGGPMLYTTSDGTPRIMAVASSIDREDCLGNSYYARTDAVADWLRDFIATDPCGTETWEGRCQGDMAVWCEDGEVLYHSCSDFGYACGRNAEGLMRCVSPCGAETWEGRCQGDVAVWCEDGEVLYHSCPDFGYVCSIDEDGNHRCVPPTECGGVTFRGYCEGETAVWCEDGELWYHFCDTFGYFCAEDEDGDHRCVSPC
jgi:V8-like Glu-specific endopeptidase